MLLVSVIALGLGVSSVQPFDILLPSACNFYKVDEPYQSSYFFNYIVYGI